MKKENLLLKFRIFFLQLYVILYDHDGIWWDGDKRESLFLRSDGR